MKIVRIVSLVGVGAIVALCWLATGASAEILNPASPYTPYQPNSKTSNFMPSVPTARTAYSTAPQTPSDAAPAASEPNQAKENVSDAPIVAPAAPKPTIAPEPVVTRARRVTIAESDQITSQTSTVTTVDSGTQGPLQDVKSFLARVAKACQVGVASVAGGPAALLAVLATFVIAMSGLAHVGHRIRDEAANELLYSAVVIAPG